jgi:hypothetical protein
MIRRLLTAVSVLSLLLFVATFALSMWSDLQRIRVEWGDAGAERGGFLQVQDGKVLFASWRTVQLSALAVGPARKSRWDLLVFELQNGNDSPTPAAQRRWVQCWFELGVLVLATMPLSIWLVIGTLVSHFKRQQRIRTGRCPVCGYDLCASTDRCPECGMLISATP